MMGRWDRWGVVDSYQCVGGGTGDGYYLIVFPFLPVLLSFVLMSCLFFSLSLVPLTRSYWGIEIVVSVM